MDAGAPNTQPYVKPALPGTTACGAKTKTCLICKQNRREHAIKGGPITDHEYVPKPCPNPAMQNGRCAQSHGGKTPAGVAHHAFKGKGRSVVLPTRMLADYEAARNNPDRLSLEAEIAELRAIKADCWRMLEQDAGLAVANVRAASQAIHKALRAAFVANKSGDAHKFAEAMNAANEADEQLREALNPVEAMEHAKRQVAELNVKVEKLLKTENSRIFDERGMITLEAALADRHTLVLSCLTAITKHVRDSEIQKAVRREISAEYARLTGRRDAAPVDAGRGSGIVNAQYSVSAD